MKRPDISEWQAIREGFADFGEFEPEENTSNNGSGGNGTGITVNGSYTVEDLGHENSGLSTSFLTHALGEIGTLPETQRFLDGLVLAMELGEEGDYAPGPQDFLDLYLREQPQNGVQWTNGNWKNAIRYMFEVAATYADERQPGRLDFKSVVQTALDIGNPFLVTDALDESYRLPAEVLVNLDVAGGLYDDALEREDEEMRRAGILSLTVEPRELTMHGREVLEAGLAIGPRALLQVSYAGVDPTTGFRKDKPFESETAFGNVVKLVEDGLNGGP